MYYDLKEISSLISFRDYAPDFYNPHSQSFAQEDDEPNDRDERGFYLEEVFKFNGKFNLKTSFDQWSHPDRKIIDRETRYQVDCYPVPFFDLSIVRRARDDDLDKAGDKKIKDYLNGRLLLGRKFEMTAFYGENRARTTDSENIKDKFSGYQLKFSNDKNIILIREKLSDNDVNAEGDKEKEYYLYLRLKQMERINLSLSFKAIHSSEDVFPNPQEIYRIVCDYLW